MSDFIDERIIIPNLSRNLYLQDTNNDLPKQNFNSKFNKEEIVKNINKLIPSLTSQYILQFFDCAHSDIIHLKLSFSNCGLKSFNVLINLQIDLGLKSISTSLAILDRQKLYKIETLDQRVLLCKLFCKSTLKNLNKLSISLSEGTLKNLKPSTFYWEQNFNDFVLGKCKENSLHNLIKSTLKDGVNAFKPIIKQLVHDMDDDPIQLGKSNPQIIKASIYRYIIKSSIQPSFDISFGSGKYQTMQCLSKQEIYYTNSMAQNICTDFTQFNTHALFLTPKVPLNSLKKLYVKEYFSSKDQELSILKTKIQPPANRSNLGLESKYAYNIIQLNESRPINLKRINTGGFSEINLGEVQFWYMLTVSQKRMAKLEDTKRGCDEVVSQTKLKKQSKKILVFKSNNYKGTESGRNRVGHQMKIVSKFKGTPSIFLPEYYKIVNQRSPFLQYLLMEHLPYPTLNEYAQFNKNSISFLTKIHLASLIIYGLQILKNNGIVHMDLKPSNIIVAKRLIVKLIDFGQSYNKQICQKNFKPAFSNPYGCPQIVDGIGKNEFNQKNDVYSWAILVFQLLFKRFPFFLSLQRTTKMLRERKYMEHIYFVPEQEQMYGSWQIMPLLRNLLFRAMDQNPKNRPYTIWLNVVLKQCLSHLINLELSTFSE